MRQRAVTGKRALLFRERQALARSSPPVDARARGRSIWLALALAVVLAACEPLGAQTIRPDDGKPLPYLLDVGDRYALVRYSPGALDRASHVHRRFSLLAEDFQKWSKRPVSLSGVLLSRTDWEALDLAVPYGLPAHLRNGEVAVCAWGDQGTVRMWRSLLGGELPQIEGHPLYGTQLEASSLLLADLLAQGVAARALLNRAGFGQVHPEVLNLAAHVVALAASHRHEPLSLGEIKRVYSMTSPAPKTAGSSDLDSPWRARLAGERPYYEAAEALIAERGVSKAPKALLGLLRRDPARATPARLAEKFPELRGLLRRPPSTPR